MSKRNAMHKNTASTKSSSIPCTDQQLHGLLNRYQDNELEPAEREQVHAHLQSCQVCRRELSQLDLITLAVKELHEVEPEPSFNAVLMDRIRQKQESRSRWFSLKPALPSMAYSLIFLVFLGLGLLVNGFFAPTGQDSLQVNAGLNEDDLVLTQLLDETRQLSLLHVQDQTFDLFGDLNNRSGNRQ